MNGTLRIMACVVVLATTARAAEPGFTQTLPPAEFASAGLDKLSAAERARLDALVKQYAEAASKPHAIRPQPRPAVTQRPLAPAPGRPSTGQARDEAGAATVTVAPGTKVEYSAVESRIAGEFTGWERGTVFALENGGRWRVESTSTYAGVRLSRPVVKIVPGILGSYWMTIEGVRQRVKVAPVAAR